MNNKLPRITFIYNRYKKATSTKPAAVEIRISHNYKQKYISTGVMLYPNQWKNGHIVNVQDALIISQSLDTLLSDVRHVIIDMMNNGNIDLYAIPDKMKELHSVNMNFLEYCEQRATIRKYGRTQDSQERYDRFLKYFKQWGKIKAFEDVNEKNILSYDQYLISRGLKTYSKWNNYHRFLNSFILDAVNERYLQRNPYRWINIEKGKHSKGIERCLTPLEFQAIKRADMPTKSLEKVRDVFIFQTYTCLSYSDLKRFDINNIQIINSTKVYISSRKKTNKGFTIPLIKAALSILDKYNDQLPIISNVKYNEYLKVVAQSAGIDKPISSHWARHTGATILLNEGVDLKIVSKICGHSSTRITEQVYAKLLDETVVNAIKKVQKNIE